jgi:uncharacterized membrane protein YsdA (DUF1294 family)
MPWTWIALWIAVASTLAFAATAFDKHRARKRGWRIPEARLLGLALLGGSPGLIAGMLVFRHKTAKASFWIAAVAIAAAHLGLAVLILAG